LRQFKASNSLYLGSKFRIMMRKFTLLFICLLGVTYFADAQVRRSSLRVDAPSVIRGYKIIDETSADPTLAAPWGRGVDSTWEGFGVDFDPANLDGCTAFTPGYFTGKFALIYRGDCEFGSKALRAQQAGARGVILVNNLLGVVGMGAGADGAAVTIPVVMVTTNDGNDIRNQISLGNPVTISLTGWRYDSIANPIDIGFMNDGVILPQGKIMPAHQLSTIYGNVDEQFRLYTGSRFYNFSVQDWDTIFVKGAITQGATAIASDSINFFYTPPGATTTDSVIFTILDTVNNVLVGHDMNDYAVGTYTKTNEIAANPSVYSETGLAPLNNTWDYSFRVQDSIYGKAQYANGSPVANSYINFGSPGEWGPVLYMRNGGFAARSASVRIMRDIIQDSIFTGQQVIMTIYEWSDNDANGGIDYATELTEVGSGDYLMTASDLVPIQGLNITVPLNNTIVPAAPIKVATGAYYWVTIKMTGAAGEFAIGADYFADYTANLGYNTSFGNPLYFNGTMFGGGFANAGSPSIALHMSKDLDPFSVNDLADLDGSVNLYPNPASSEINVSLDLKDVSKEATYVIMDMTGKTLAYEVSKNVTTDVVSFNTSSYAAGTYLMTVHTDFGQKQMKFTVK